MPSKLNLKLNLKALKFFLGITSGGGRKAQGVCCKV
jgi:hypothetical protein